MDPAKIHAGLVEKGKEAARTRAKARTTDRYRKQIKARAKLHAMSLGSTAAKAEEEAGYAAVEYEAAQAWLDVWRTLEATKRAEMTLR